MDHFEHRLSAIEDSEAFQRVFKPSWSPEDGYRRLPDGDDDEALAEALMLGASDLDRWVALFDELPRQR